MIVLGADMHKRSHTIAAVDAATGAMLTETTVHVGARGFEQVLVSARGLGRQRVWALEDGRHVSGSFERFLIGRGERAIRVPTTLMAGERRGSRRRGKSDSIDALAIARAALRKGTDSLPTAQARRCRSRSAAARRSPRTPDPPTRCPQQHPAMASPRPLARAQDPGLLAVPRPMERP